MQPLSAGKSSVALRIITVPCYSLNIGLAFSDKVSASRKVKRPFRLPAHFKVQLQKRQPKLWPQTLSQTDQGSKPVCANFSAGKP